MKRLPLAALCISLIVLQVPTRAWSSQEVDRSKLTPAEREKLLAAEQRAALRARAAADAAKTAKDLEATAAELERLAAEATKAAKAARARAKEAAARAAAFGTPPVVPAERPKEETPEENPERPPARTSPKADGAGPTEGEGPGEVAGPGGWIDDWTLERPAPADDAPKRRPQPSLVPETAPGGGPESPTEAPASAASAVGPAQRAARIEDIRALVKTAATRTAEENKRTFIPPIRATRAYGPKRTRSKGYTFPPGEAPDIGDEDIYCTWQWGMNIARGKGTFAGADFDAMPKTGHVDLARLSFQPDPESEFAVEGMKWGMRRHNLGDVTVTDCDFTAIPKEHGIYDALAGHALYRGNTFFNLGGQALQIAHRASPFQQYGADNMRFKGPPLIVVEDSHAVDCSQHASRAGFVWSFFDPGSIEQPGTVILRGCTVVTAWPFVRSSGGDTVPADHPEALRTAGGLVVHNYAERPEGTTGRATRAVVLDACLFDLTMGRMAVAAIRGAETVLIKDSTFLAREHRYPYVDIDDVPGNPSGKVVLQNCISPEPHAVWLRVRHKRIVPVHCPGKRIEIDVKTLAVVESEPQDDPLCRVISPLEERAVASGTHPQPVGHVDDLGAIEFRYRPR